MHNFLKVHNEVVYNSDIPHFSSLCKVRKNALLLEKEINSSLRSSDILSPTAHLYGAHTCDSRSKNFMLGNCPKLLKLGLLLSDLKADGRLISFLQSQ